MARLRSLLFALVAGIGAAGSSGIAQAAGPNVSSLTAAPVTVYGAKWCSACRALESGLRDRKIAFEAVDVDDNAAVFARARAASGSGNAIPLTGIVRSNDTVWVVGANVDAVDRAQRGD